MMKTIMQPQTPQTLFDSSLSIQNPSSTLSGGFNPDLIFRSNSTDPLSATAGSTQIRTIEFNDQATGNPYTVRQAKLAQLVSDINWDVKGVGDFNEDGVGDLVWRNKLTGENAVWLMKNSEGTVQLDKGYFIQSANKDWQIKGVADFNGDGQENILWQNSTSGENAIWGLNYDATNTSNPISIDTSKTTFIKSTPAGWDMNGWADFNNDGVLDISWSKQTTGENAIWELTDTATGTDPYFSKSYFIQNSGANSGWKVEGVSDFNRDGVNDFLWRNNNTNEVAVWNMGISNGETQLAKSYLIQKPGGANWEIVSAVNTDKDFAPEIVWTNYSTGENAIWDLKVTNGDVSLDKGYFLPNSDDSSWRFNAIAYS
jgi:hypothetical protein